MKKTLGMLLRIVILGAILFCLLNPSLLPVSGEMKEAFQTEISNVFGASSGTLAITLPKLLTILAVILVLWLIVSVLHAFLNLFTASRRARKRTVAEILHSVVSYAAVIIGIVWILEILGVSITGIFASLSILTLIIGFGAQSLIEDTITGLFILIENQYNIGDVIVLEDFRGIVRKIGIRTTVIEDTGGNLKIVNNSDIRNFQNRSGKLSLAICDVGTPYSSDIRDIEKILLPALPEIYERNEDIFEAEPIYKGVQELGESAVIIRVAVRCREINIFEATRALNREIKILFDENGIEIPFNQITVHQE